MGEFAVYTYLKEKLGPDTDRGVKATSSAFSAWRARKHLGESVSTELLMRGLESLAAEHVASRQKETKTVSGRLAKEEGRGRTKEEKRKYNEDVQAAAKAQDRAVEKQSLQHAFGEAKGFEDLGKSYLARHQKHQDVPAATAA